MKNGKWEIMTNIIGGKEMYRAYRLICPDEPMHSGNLEFAGDYCSDIEVIKNLVDLLNNYNSDGGEKS